MPYRTDVRRNQNFKFKKNHVNLEGRQCSQECFILWLSPMGKFVLRILDLHTKSYHFGGKISQLGPRWGSKHLTLISHHKKKSQRFFDFGSSSARCPKWVQKCEYIRRKSDSKESKSDYIADVIKRFKIKSGPWKNEFCVFFFIFKSKKQYFDGAEISKRIVFEEMW